MCPASSCLLLCHSFWSPFAAIILFSSLTFPSAWPNNGIFLLQLKKKIKKWEAGFYKEHERKCSKEDAATHDMRAFAALSLSLYLLAVHLLFPLVSLYKEYDACKKKIDRINKGEATPQKKEPSALWKR